MFTTNAMNTTTRHPYIRVRAERPPRVRIQHTYTRAQSYKLTVTAYSIYDVMDNVTKSTMVNITEGINVTIINVADYVITGENITVTLEPHTGQFLSIKLF